MVGWFGEFLGNGEKRVVVVVVLGWRWRRLACEVAVVVIRNRGNQLNGMIS